jgi:hypothetical protein
MIAKGNMIAWAGVAVITSISAAGVEVSLAWETSPDPVAGYAIYSQVSGSTQAVRTDVGSVTNAVISNLTPGATYTFYATAYDTNNVESDPSNVVSFTIPGATNQPPTMEPIPNMVADEGRTLQFTAKASDPENQALRFSLGTNAPAGASINTTTGLFSWTPTATQAPSTNTVTLIVTDSGQPTMSASRTFTIIARAGTFLQVATASSSAQLVKGSVQVTPRGTLNPEGTKYIYGTSASALAQPQSGAYFSHWIMNGVTYTQNPLSFSMTANRNLTAYFGLGSGGIKLTSTTTTATASSSTSTTSLARVSTTEPTTTYVLESSTNLVEWNTITNVVASEDVDTNSIFRIRAATE